MIATFLLSMLLAIAPEKPMKLQPKPAPGFPPGITDPYEDNEIEEEPYEEEEEEDDDPEEVDCPEGSADYRDARRGVGVLRA